MTTSFWEKESPPRSVRLRARGARLHALLFVAGLLLSAGVAHAIPTTFRYVPLAGKPVTSVSVRGSFNNWGEDAMARGDDGIWSLVLDVSAGAHEYKFFIDGQWPSDMATGRDGGPIDPDASEYKDDGYGGKNAVRTVGAAESAAKPPSSLFEVTAAPKLSADHARIHYHRPDGNYAGWGLHTWLDAAKETPWANPLSPTGQTTWGLYWDVPLAVQAARLGFILHKGDTKDPGPDQALEVAGGSREAWVVSGRNELYDAAPDVSALPVGDLTRQEAHWVDARTILWAGPTPGDAVFLHASATGTLRIEPSGVEGGETFALGPANTRSDANVDAHFPHLAALPAWRLPDEAISRAPELLRGQIAVSARDKDGRTVAATGIQIPGVLDDLFLYQGPLGLSWKHGVPSLDLWAPTARDVHLLVFGDPLSDEPSERLAMTRGLRGDAGGTGVWSLVGQADWKRLSYLYEVLVFVPRTGKFETNLVTDPYARGLTRNSARTLFVDLDDPALAPEGWDTLRKPTLDAPEDIVLYELHVRDFSALDEATPAALRGTYLAFTLDTPPTRHLRRLAAAGLTHVHLLPVFDIATVDEDRSRWPAMPDLSGLAPDSEEQQARLAPLLMDDGFNWGYDPFHFGVPEGSYATDAEGPARVLEFRRMVAALDALGLRVVMDVVYNHTHASGQDPVAVFDRIVPGYYHRLDEAGNVHTSTCCQNTASEHAMMERFIGDDLVHWARDYKIDGFRFDLMGHHMRENLVAWRDRLASQRPAADGVDGTKIFLYGEGWDFGEVQGGKRGVNATQQGLAGTGIGTFNDRIRDAIRGGNPFGDRREQGFATGLFVQPAWNGSGPGEREKLLDLTDRIRVGLAGNLADYKIVTRDGRETTGSAMNGTGYTTDPQEAIQYASAHDNETLFDKILYAAPSDLPLDEKIRMQTLALSVVALAQGVPFFHAGSEILRSKNFDADSYNSGDWFNRLDFTHRSNGFGRGLPPAGKNRDRWSFVRPLLARRDQEPTEEQIRSALSRFEELLQLRRSSPLFRLRSAEEIRARVRFHNTGPTQQEALVVMSISDDPGEAHSDGTPFANLDPAAKRLVVVVNAHPEERTFAHPGLRGRTFELHSVQAGSVDERTRSSRFDNASGSFIVAGRTTAVFVESE